MMRSKAALPFIFTTILLDAIGLGVVIPVFPKLIADMTGGGMSVAAGYGGWLSFTYAIMQFVFAPILGNLSDSIGRRPVLLISLMGLSADYVLLALAPNIGWLFVGRALAGILGASHTTASAYIADISTPETKAQNFGLIGAAFGIGFVLGPVIGGVVGQFGVRMPFWVSAALALINLLYGWFIVPESLPKELRRAFDWKRANPLGSLAHLRKYPMVASLIAALLLLYISNHGLESTWTYYVIEKFHWHEAEIGYSLGAFGIMMVMVQGLLIRVVMARLGVRLAVIIGFSLRMLGNLLFAFASQGWMLYAIIVPHVLGFVATPALQAIVSDNVPADEQGELQGALGSMMSVNQIVGPLLMTNVFAAFTHSEASVYFPGSPFIVAVVLVLCSLFLVERFLRTHALQTKRS
jgi:DHA1 family tetracycline resistance protein-like MFS transporter